MPRMTEPATPPSASSRKAAYAYGALAVLLLSYVVVASPNWTNLGGSDGWEYHRAVVALTRDLGDPGNPTFALDTPSVRYSPYTVGLALVCRTTGVDAFTGLCLGAAAGCVLFVAGLRAWLGAFGLGDAAPWVLAVTLSLWGGRTFFASIWALEAFSINALNPSMLSLGLGFLMWAAFRRWSAGRAAWAAWPAIGLVGAVAILSHASTGTFAFLGLWLLAAGAAGTRRRLFVGAAACSAGAFVLCALWPWFDFLAAAFGSVLSHDQNPSYWEWAKAASVTSHLWAVWCAPALLLFPLAVRYTRTPIGRFCLFGAVLCFVLPLLAFFRPSLTLERLPILGMVFLHVPIALFVRDSDILRPRRWPGLVSALRNGNPGASVGAGAQILVVAVFAYCLLPQFFGIATKRHVARPAIAPLFGKAPLSSTLLPSLTRLLEPVGEDDVVMSDIRTSWVVPSIRGKVIAALHREFFVQGQHERVADMRDFMYGDDAARQAAILDEYRVRWIVLAEYRLKNGEFGRLLEPDAVVGTDDTHVLMDALRWRELRAPPK